MKQLWLVHAKQMEHHDKSKSGAIPESEEDNEDTLRQERVEKTIVGKPPGFSAPG